ncbi:hypothetical protein C0995_012009 [Termitomyces sp. Mi166|nr:hypothetical protein C0995_012009 [Termitomyces sp. Mi166\
MATPTTPSKSTALIKDKTRCILQTDIRVKVINAEVSKYPEHKNQVYTLVKGSQVMTKGNPEPAIETGSTEPLSVDNACYRITGSLLLPVYETKLGGKISWHTTWLVHSNLKIHWQPANVGAQDMSKPLVVSGSGSQSDFWPRFDPVQ